MSSGHGRVAHVMRSYGEPSQTFVADAIRGVDAHGWESWVVARVVRNRAWFDHPPDDRVLVAERPGRARLLAARARRQTPLERTAGWYTPAVRRTRPAVVHAHFGWAGVLGLPAVEQLDVPLVVTFHATDVTVWPHQAAQNRQAYMRVFPRLTTAVVVSKFTERTLRALGYQGPAEVIPPGVTLDGFPFRGAQLPTGEVRLLFVGRLVPRKGLDVLLRALPSVASELPLTLTVVGDGPLRAESEALAAELGLARRVAFVGARAPAEVRSELERAHVLVMPSRTTADGEAEGSPVVPKEGLAIGVQVVATDNGGTREVLPPVLHDAIVAEGDPAALATTLERLLAAQDTWGERAAAGRAWIEQEFDAGVLATRLSAVYDSALAGRGLRA